MTLIIYSAFSGIVGMGLGGLVAAIFGGSSQRTISAFLAFAGGVMTSIVCFGLIPESIHLGRQYITVMGLIIGILVIMLLNRAVDIITNLRDDKLLVHETPQELMHEDDLINNKSILRSGFIMLVAIGLHNIPEGMAMGAGGAHDVRLGLIIAVMIALHNIPEGMAIAAPLIAGGMGRTKVVLLTMLSGAPTILGAIIGIAFGMLSDSLIALSLAAAGGAMLYVVFGEVIPQVVLLRRDRMSTLILLFGVIVGLFVANAG